MQKFAYYITQKHKVTATNGTTHTGYVSLSDHQGNLVVGVYERLFRKILHDHEGHYATGTPRWEYVLVDPLLFAVNPATIEPQGQPFASEEISYAVDLGTSTRDWYRNVSVPFKHITLPKEPPYLPS